MRTKAHHVNASNQNGIALALIALEFREMLNSCIHTSAKKLNYNRTFFFLKDTGQESAKFENLEIVSILILATTRGLHC